jgi:hypothetical protein
LIFKLNILIGI